MWGNRRTVGGRLEWTIRMKLTKLITRDSVSLLMVIGLWGQKSGCSNPCCEQLGGVIDYLGTVTISNLCCIFMDIFFLTCMDGMVVHMQWVEIQQHTPIDPPSLSSPLSSSFPSTHRSYQT